MVAASAAKPVSTRCEVLHSDWLRAMTPITHDRVVLLPAAYETPDSLALPVFYPVADTRVLGASPFANPTLPFGGGPGVDVTPSPPGGPTIPPPTTPPPPGGPPVVPPVSAAPEPAVWLQMMSAVALIGEALRRRRRLRPL